MHVALSPAVDHKGLAEVERLLPKVLADVQRVATDATALIATLSELAGEVESNAGGRFSAPTDKTSGNCCVGWVTGTSCCWATNGAGWLTGWSTARGQAVWASCGAAPVRVPG